jgi:hypothetical protein
MSYAAPMTIWVPLISAFVGALAGISGAWISQLGIRKIEADKRSHEQKKTQTADRKQLFVDIVEYAEDRIAWLRYLEWYGGREERAKLNLHPSQLAGRVKLSAPHWVILAWDEFDGYLEDVNSAISLGNIHPHRDLPDIIEFDDDTLVPRAHIRGEILIAAVRAEHEGESLAVLMEAMKSRLNRDHRLLPALDHWRQAASKEDSPWRGAHGALPGKKGITAK